MAANDATKTIALGLQGGGSHCAFTWGVLDVLLDEVQAGRLRIAAISGASGGALTGAVCAYGLLTGPEEARRLLEQFWLSVSDQSLWPENPLRAWLPPGERWNVDWDPLAIGFGLAEQVTSPYWSPWRWQDLIGELLTQVIGDFGRFGTPGRHAPKLFVRATAVDRTARRIFGPGEITLQALLASAALPTLFQAVEIDGVHYWDGGYLANPAMDPLLDCADDLLTVLIDPLNVSGGPPITPRQIVNRINEVSFNASWVLEMRQIELINRLLQQGHLTGSKYRQKRLHLISNDRYMEEIGAASKIVPSREFLLALRDAGREAGRNWLAANHGALGVRSTLDTESELALRLGGSGTAMQRLAPRPAG